VTRVVNQIETEEEAAAEKSDTWIERKVNFALLLRRNVSMTGTTVTVSDGVVTLAGEASSQAQKDLTASYAADVDGVVSVVNQPWSQPGQQPVDPGSDPDALRRGIWICGGRRHAALRFFVNQSFTFFSIGRSRGRGGVSQKGIFLKGRSNKIKYGAFQYAVTQPHTQWRKKMKTSQLQKGILLAVLSAVSFSVRAQPGEGRRPGPPPEVRERVRERMDKNGDGEMDADERRAMRRRMEMRKESDADGDGRLNEEERAAHREKMEARRAEHIKRFDADGDGELSPEERAKARETVREETRARMLERFDADGDGELSREERAKAREERGPRMPPPGEGRPPRRGPPPPPEELPVE